MIMIENDSFCIAGGVDNDDDGNIMMAMTMHQ